MISLLLDGKKQGLVPEVRHTFDSLQTSGFYMSEHVYKRGLGLAGELEDG